jgi:hypothetical protein
MSDEMPSLSVDWDSGEGDLRLGQRLAAAAPRFRYDVLADWRDRIDLLRDEAAAQADPDRRERELHRQREHNARRRELCEHLGGVTIAMAEPLVNGDVLLHLASGQAMVLYARHEDVKLDRVADAAHARRYALQDGTGDWYVREDAASEARPPA